MHFALVRFRPDGKPVARIDQLRRDAHPIAVAPNTTFEHMLDVQLHRDFPKLGFPILEPKRRAPRRHPQAIYFGQCSEKLLRNTLTEVGVLFCSAQIIERQNGDRFLVRAARLDDVDLCFGRAIWRAHDSVTGEIEKPGEKKSDGETEPDEEHYETHDPVLNIEHRENLCDTLRKRPTA